MRSGTLRISVVTTMMEGKDCDGVDDVIVVTLIPMKVVMMMNNPGLIWVQFVKSS